MIFLVKCIANDFTIEVITNGLSIEKQGKMHYEWL